MVEPKIVTPVDGATSASLLTWLAGVGTEIAAFADKSGMTQATFQHIVYTGTAAIVVSLGGYLLHKVGLAKYAPQIETDIIKRVEALEAVEIKKVVVLPAVTT